MLSSQDLCLAALTFAYDTLVPGGHFVCKFYQGAEDKAFELRLKKLFEKVVREKPESSRKVGTRPLCNIVFDHETKRRVTGVQGGILRRAASKA